MKVDIVNQTNPSVGFNRNLKAKHRPNFTGAASAATQAVTEGLSDTARNREITKWFMNGLSQAGALNMMKKFEWLKGEIGGILITAIGTGTVAPIFIAFNPFAKAPKNATPEEKKKNTETKEYTAMRQPISAALAILFQASVQKYIDKGLDAYLNNPKHAKYARFDEDHTLLNTDTYIKSQVRKEMKKEGKNKPSVLKYFFGDKVAYKGEKVSQRTYYDSIFNDRVDAVKDKQLQKLAETIRENADNKEVTGFIPLATGEYWKNKDVAEIVNKQIDSYIKSTDKMKKSRDVINAKVDRAKLLIENEDYLRNLFKDIPGVETAENGKKYTLEDVLQKRGETTKALEAAKETVENDAKLTAEHKEQIKGLIQEILDRPDDLRAHRVERTLWRIDNIKEMCGGKFTPDTYRDAMLKKNEVLETIAQKLSALKIKDVEHVTKDEITETIKNVVEQCHFDKKSKAKDAKVRAAILDGTSTFGEDKGKLLTKVYKDLAKGVQNVIKNSHTSWSQFIKIAVGVFVTLPITCTALNWVYPRFMEIFFPKLAGVKKDSQPQKTGGDK